MAASASHTPVLPGFPEPEQTPTMHVRKRNGALDSVDVNKIVRAVQRCAHGLQHVDVIRVASKTIGGLYDDATTREFDTISINTAASLIVEEPWYREIRQYLGFVADSRLQRLGIAPAFRGSNPFPFMELQDVQERTNFFECRVSAYQVSVPGEVAFNEDF